MNEKLNYISDEELEQLIFQVEQNELVSASPDLTENILEAVGLLPKPVEVKPKASKKKEFYAYCFRVITSVAAAVALVFLLPELSGWMGQKVSLTEGKNRGIYRQETPDFEDVVKSVPGKEEVVTAKPAPTKEEVLNDSGFLERILKDAFRIGNNNKAK